MALQRNRPRRYVIGRDPRHLSPVQYESAAGGGGQAAARCSAVRLKSHLSCLEGLLKCMTLLREALVLATACPLFLLYNWSSCCRHATKSIWSLLVCFQQMRPGSFECSGVEQMPPDIEA